MDSIREILEKNIELARLGRQNWHELKKQYLVDKYIILPHNDDEYNLWAAKYLNVFLKREKANSVAVISAYKNDLDKFESDEFIIEKILKDSKWIDSVIKFYGLYNFSRKVIIVSLTEPYDTCGENLLGVKGITKKELVCYDIYGFSEIPNN